MLVVAEEEVRLVEPLYGGHGAFWILRHVSLARSPVTVSDTGAH